MPGKHVKYAEGQWFAVPLRGGGYALGIIVRGSYKTKGGLGYFFGPKYPNIPDNTETYLKNKDNAILIRRFGDLGIITGEWPLIQEGKPFLREDWPVPLFRKIQPIREGMVIVVEYGQDYSGLERPLRAIMTAQSEEILKLPKDLTAGSGAVEIALTKLLKESA